MNMDNVAMSIAEGDPSYKMDVSLVFGSTVKRDKVLRTSFDSLEVWSKKYVKVNKSPFERRIDSVTKKAAIIDQEVWVYGIDSTISHHIVSAVKIAAEWFDISPKAFMQNIYAKNLNAEGEHAMSESALIQENKKLYTGVGEAIQEAARMLKVKGNIDFWVMSSNINHKLPKQELHQALKQGGAKRTAVAKQKYRYMSGSNNAEKQQMLITNLHLGRFNI